MAGTHVCPATHAVFLDNWIRKIIHNPHKILKPFIRGGMKVADIRCGPGFFTLPMAELVGADGLVYAYDLQEEMLKKIIAKIEGTGLESKISVHRCQEKHIGFAANVDCVLGFFMVHEVPDVQALTREVYSALDPGGVFLVIEPLFHVNRKQFKNICNLAKDVGFSLEKGPRVFWGRSVALRK